MNFQIISDGACDLLPQYTELHNVTLVSFYVTYDGSTYYKEETEIDHDLFYQRMDQEHIIPKSSLPSVDDYMEAFLPFVEKKESIICICITSKFSGSYNSAVAAKSQILEQYPDAAIEVIDSTLNTVTEGLFVNEAVRMRDDGLTFNEAVTALNQIKSTGRIYFTVGSLEYLVKNGRVGKLATIAGDRLSIKPIIIMKDGEISLGGITRSHEKAKKNIFKLVNNFFEDNKLSKEDYTFTIGTGYDYEEAKEFQLAFEEACNITCNKEIKALIGTTIGCHTGPHPLGIGFIKKYK